MALSGEHNEQEYGIHPRQSDRRDSERANRFAGQSMRRQSVFGRVSPLKTLVSLRTETAVDRIENCDDFQSLDPRLSEWSSIRSALAAFGRSHARVHSLPQGYEGSTLAKRGSAESRYATRRYSLQPVVLRWGIAAALVIGFGLLALPFIQRYAPFGGPLEATVEAAEGQVYQIADTTSTPVIAGQRLQKGERVRTAKDAHAFVRLGDGSMIEMKDRSELSVNKNAQGTTIHSESRQHRSRSRKTTWRALVRRHRRFAGFSHGHDLFS